MSEGKFKRLVEENYDLEKLVNFERIERLKADKMATSEALELIDNVFKRFWDKIFAQSGNTTVRKIQYFSVI